MSSPTAPTATTVPRSRASSPARVIGSSEAVSAQINTLSKPCPWLKLRPASSAPLRKTAVAPRFCASATREGSRSMPKTVQPAAWAIPTVSKPKRPRPIMATRSPTCGCARRKPCRAIAPRVAKAADSKSTSSGTGANKFFGTKAYSAWTAKPPPAQATRSPTW